jgi:hypothetical protein
LIEVTIIPKGIDKRRKECVIKTPTLEEVQECMESQRLKEAPEGIVSHLNY